jgi:hypothetical protein
VGGSKKGGRELQRELEGLVRGGGKFRKRRSEGRKRGYKRREGGGGIERG